MSTRTKTEIIVKPRRWYLTSGWEHKGKLIAFYPTVREAALCDEVGLPILEGTFRSTWDFYG